MVAQFSSFIVEPFVEKKIGADGTERWGILLDAPDELEGEDAQSQLIQLIIAFVHEHRGAPLVWIISHWSEYIPIDSTEACEDIERFLQSSFQATWKKFRHCIPRGWPSNIEFLKLAAAALGLFVYAEAVIQFIKDPVHADPASRLEVLVSVIDCSNAVPTKENPLVHLDALYREILSSVPSTKRLPSYVIHVDKTRFKLKPLPHRLQTLSHTLWSLSSRHLCMFTEVPFDTRSAPLETRP